MNRPHLIQRMKFKEDPCEDPSVDELLNMTYMGSAEFEWGALPNSLKRMTKSFEDFNIFIVCTMSDASNGPLVLISHTDEYTTFFPKLIDGTIRLKETSKLKEAMTGKYGSGRPVEPRDKIDAWWDIENDVMFCFGKSRAEQILKAIKRTREKKMLANEEGWF